MSLSTLKYIVAIAVLIVIAIPAVAVAQGDGDPFHPHNSECISTPWLIIANGRSDVDVSTAGTLVARADGEADLLHVSRTNVPDATVEFLRRKFDNQSAPSTVALYVVGGQKVVGPGVISEIDARAPVREIRRLDGEGREETVAMSNFVNDC